VAAVGLAVTALFVVPRAWSGRSDAPRALGQSVAVLPFASTGADPTTGYYADGFSDELARALGRVRGMRVAAHASTAALQRRGLPLEVLADSLGVGTVLRGTVRRSGDRLVVTAELVSAREHQVVWSETLDGQASEVFAMQERIAREVVGTLQGRTRGAGGMRAAGRPTPDLEAYELYLLARHGWTGPMRERLERAAVYYQRAAERDPTFALAYAGLAETYVNLANYGYMPSAQALTRAEVAARRALALDPDLPEAHTASAFVLGSRMEFPAAEAAFRRAILLNPSYAHAHHFYSLLLLMLGRTDEALEHNRQALELNPLFLPAQTTRGVVFTQRGELPAARRELQRAVAMAPDYAIALHYLGAVHAAEGAYAEARRLLESASRLAPGFPGVPGALAYVHARSGDAPAAEAILGSLRRERDERSRANLAFAHAARGELDLAFALLEGVRWETATLIELRADPLLAPLRSDPRYARLIQSIVASRA
jgi:TolB-like protein/tetratricopeptide (TPR) repeat protein